MGLFPDIRIHLEKRTAGGNDNAAGPSSIALLYTSSFENVKQKFCHFGPFCPFLAGSGLFFLPQQTAGHSPVRVAQADAQNLGQKRALVHQAHAPDAGSGDEIRSGPEEDCLVILLGCLLYTSEGSSGAYPGDLLSPPSPPA